MADPLECVEVRRSWKDGAPTIDGRFFGNHGPHSLSSDLILLSSTEFDSRSPAIGGSFEADVTGVAGFATPFLNFRA